MFFILYRTDSIIIVRQNTKENAMRKILALVVAAVVTILVAGLIIEVIHLPPVIGWAIGIVVAWLVGNLIGKSKKPTDEKEEEKHGQPFIVGRSRDFPRPWNRGYLYEESDVLQDERDSWAYDRRCRHYCHSYWCPVGRFSGFHVDLLQRAILTAGRVDSSIAMRRIFFF
jgi:hypothetical protein